MDSRPGRRIDSWFLACDELATVCKALQPHAFDAFAARFDQIYAHRTFFTGQGRSGLVAKMTAMRFMHLGLTAHAVGEATTPSIRSNDTLVVISGSGRTPTSVAQASTAQSHGATVLLVTHQADSPLQQLADHVIVLPAATSKQFGGTLFEHSALLLMDAIVLDLTRTLRVTDATMHAHHTKLE